VVTITGAVILSRGDEGVMRGTKVVYDVGRGTVAVTSDSEPVFGIFNSQRTDSQRPGARPPATDN
jgi:lipopolysaccharide export system protein LptA